MFKPPFPRPSPIGAFSTFPTKVLDLGGPPATSPREGITDAMAIYQKGTLSLGEASQDPIFSMVCKKINYRVIRPKLGNVMISKHSQDTA
jgi:hypothetical protein